MKLIRDIQGIVRLRRNARRRGLTIALVPTMGALHRGHMALVAAAQARADVTIVSIFVNPMQFGPGEDYQRYPRALTADAALCRAAKVDGVFAPRVEQLYPPGFCSRVTVARLGDQFEGRSRPGHFSGVATIVAKLFGIVQPDIAVFGQKDYQQTVVIRRMVEDLNIPVQIVIAPTVRESDGLALSSRNRYLSAIERPAAVVLHAALAHGAELALAGESSSSALIRAMTAIVTAERHARLDYFAIVDANDLTPLTALDRPAALLGALWIGRTRLIDNVLVTPPAKGRKRAS